MADFCVASSIWQAGADGVSRTGAAGSGMPSGVLFWGCQGPDPLFYRKILLGSPLHKLGNRMHSEKTDELFAALSRAVRDLSGDAQEIAAAYFYGFVCHYALDSEIHPYVYCRQVQFCTEKLEAVRVGGAQPY